MHWLIFPIGIVLVPNLLQTCFSQRCSLLFFVPVAGRKSRLERRSARSPFFALLHGLIGILRESLELSDANLALPLVDIEVLGLAAPLGPVALRRVQGEVRVAILLLALNWDLWFETRRFLWLFGLDEELVRKLGLHLHTGGLLELDHLQGQKDLLLLQEHALKALNDGVELLAQLSLDFLLQDIANFSKRLRLLGGSLGHLESGASSVQAGVDILPEVVLVAGLLHQVVVSLAHRLVARIGVLLPKSWEVERLLLVGILHFDTQN